MAYNNYNRGFEIDEEKTAEFLETAVEKITTEEDIDTLVELAKLFKKYVPLTRRKYVIAYLPEFKVFCRLFFIRQDAAGRTFLCVFFCHRVFLAVLAVCACS